MFMLNTFKEKISFYALLLEAIGFIIMVSTVLTWIVRWTQDKIFFLKEVKFWIPFMDRCIECLQSDSIHYLKAMPLSHRLSGFLADGVTMAIIVAAIYCAICLMRCFRGGEIFSSQTIALLNKLSKLTLLWAFYGPINVFIMSKIAFYSATSEQRTLAMAFATDDAIIKLVFFGFFLVIALMMQEGYRLKNEQDLTV